jgi:ribosomal protein S5
VVHATVDALQQLVEPTQLVARRGLSLEQVGYQGN